MPLVQHQVLKEVEAPDKPHLALLTKEYEGPVALPIKPGSIMMIIMDPKDPVRGMYPIALVRVSPKRLDFMCPCGQSNCSRRVVFHATWSGKHPHGTDQISMK